MIVCRRLTRSTEQAWDSRTVTIVDRENRGHQQPTPGRVLVTGATGLLGQALARSLLAEGVAVRVLLRHSAAEARGLGLEVALGDLRQPETLAPALEGIDCVYHCAGLMHPPPGEEQDLARVNAEGTAALARQAAAAGVRRFVFVSSVSVYGEGPLVDVSEDHPTSPEAAYGMSKRAAEESLASMDDLPWVVLRPCAIYRPGVTPFLSLWVQWAVSGGFPLINDGQTLVDLVHVDDVVTALRLAATSDRAVGRAYNIAEGPRRSVRDMVASLSRLLGREVTTLAADRPLGRLRLRLSAQGGGRGRLDKRLLEALTLDRHFLIDRAQRELGFAPRHTLEQSLAETLAVLSSAEDVPCRS